MDSFEVYEKLERLHRDVSIVTSYHDRYVGIILQGILNVLAALNQRIAHCPLCSLRNSLPLEVNDAKD